MEGWLEKANIPLDRVKEQFGKLKVLQPCDLLSLPKEIISLNITINMKPLEKVRFDRSLRELKATTLQEGKATDLQELRTTATASTY
jgi:hypothetical protein